jgi:hypothetical protein
MIPVKVQCPCGQRYAFDVEPINGRVPSPVACPVCGVDGTAAANEIIAQALAAQPIPSPPAVLRVRVPAAEPGSSSSSAPLPPTAASSQTFAPRPSPPKTNIGKDGWAAEESQLNKLGTYITVIPAILAAFLGAVGVEVPTMTVCIVVGVSGLVGGALNVAGRGPIVAGAIVGLFIALGGYGAVLWWIHDRKSVRKFEILIAFAVGAAPGFLLQYALQRILRKRALS